MLFTPFPLLRGDVYKGLGAFFCFVVGIFFFTPLGNSPSPFIFCALEKQNWNKIFKKPPKLHYQKKKKEDQGPSFHLPCPAPAKAPFAGAHGVGMEPVIQPHVGRGEAGGGVCSRSPRSAWLLGAIFPKSLPASENFQLSDRNALAEHTVLMGNRTRH